MTLVIYKDEDGYLYLGGRKDDLIIRGGENISPEELENVIYAHPAVDDVAVIGIPDPEWGEVPAAVVVMRAGQKINAEEMMEFCRERLSSFKRPRCVYFVDALPRNPMGKVLKKQLRETYRGGNLLAYISPQSSSLKLAISAICAYNTTELMRYVKIISTHGLTERLPVLPVNYGA